MTYCKKCGKELTSSGIKCPYCGENSTLSTGGEAAAPRKIRKIIIPIIAVSVLAIATAVFFVVHNLRNNPASILARAERYSTEQNYEQAINEFQRLIEIKPDDAAAYIGLADAYVGLEQPDKSVEVLKRGFDETGNESISVRLIDLLSESANKHLNENNYERAISEFDQIVKIDGQNIPAYMGVADAYVALNDFDGAISALKAGCENASDESITTALVGLLFKSADKSLSDNNYEKAIMEFEQILKIDKKSANAFIGTADCYMGLENNDKAIKTLQSGYEATGDKNIKSKLTELLSECADKYRNEKNYDEAAEQLAQLIKLDDTNASVYISLADVYTSADSADKALETLEKGLEKTNDSSIKTKLVSLLTQSANRSLSEKKYQQALTSFKKLADIDTKNSSAYIGAANAYIGLEQNDAAIKVLQDGYDKTKNSNIKNMLVKRRLISTGSLSAEQSIAEYQRILELDDQQKDAYLGLADAYKELAQNENAVEILQKGYDKTGDADIKSMLNEFTYAIEPFSAEMYTTTDISVRTEPDISSEKIGSFGRGESVTVTGKAKNGWCRINYKNGEYFVNGEYLSSSMPAAPEPAPDTTPTPANTAESLLNSVVLHPQKTGDALLDPLVESILAKITNSNMSTYEKVKACYDYAINNFSYGQGDGFIGWGIKGWAYEVLTSNIGVCNNYSSAFAVMTRAIGLEAYLQNGQTSSSRGGYTGHTWCVIMINGTPYLFDPQVEDNIAKGGAVYYYKFCKPYDDGNVNGYYIPNDAQYYLENETSVNGDLLIEPDGTMIWPGGSGGSWWMFF